MDEQWQANKKRDEEAECSHADHEARAQATREAAAELPVLTVQQYRQLDGRARDSYCEGRSDPSRDDPATLIRR